MNSTRVFIGGLENTITRENIEEEFAKFGKLDNVWIAQNPPGFAFIVYESEQDAEEAVKSMNNQSFMNCTLRVEFSRPRKRRGFEPRGQRGQYGGRPRYNGNSSYSNYGNSGGNYAGGNYRGDRFDRGGYGKTPNQNGVRDSRRGGGREFRSNPNQSPPSRYD